MTQAVTDFYNALTAIASYEKQLKEAEENLKDWYEILIAVCPHSEAIEFNHNMRGWGPHRRCKICGVWDHGNYGATSGDEYNYGYPGRPHPEFWKGANIEVTKSKDTWDSYSRRHNYSVANDGTVKKGI